MDRFDLGVELHEDWLHPVGDGVARVVDVVQVLAERTRQNVVVVLLRQQSKATDSRKVEMQVGMGQSLPDATDGNTWLEYRSIPLRSRGNISRG
jgi:hypothetical protein